MDAKMATFLLSYQTDFDVYYLILIFNGVNAIMEPYFCSFLNFSLAINMYYKTFFILTKVQVL